MKTAIEGADYPLPSPHCDPRVLHGPGVCRFLRQYKKWQAKRVQAKILFTGELHPQPCRT